MSIVDVLRNLDTNDPGRWPLPIRIGAIGVVFVAIVAVGVYLFVIKEEVTALERAQLEEQELRAQFEYRLLPGKVFLRRVAEAVLVLMRIELPVVECPLGGRDGEGAELGNIVAVPHRALAEIVVGERVAERMAVKVERRARPTRDGVQHFVDVARDR